MHTETSRHGIGRTILEEHNIHTLKAAPSASPLHHSSPPLPLLTHLPTCPPTHTHSSLPLRQVQESKAKTWCGNKGEIPYMETSAKEAINVESAFLAASHKALAKEQEPLKIENDQVIDINRDSSQGSGGGCCKKS